MSAKKMLICLMIIVFALYSQPVTGCTCYNTTTCSGSCSTGTCVPRPTSRPTVSNEENPHGWTALGTSCAQCVKVVLGIIIILGSCGPSLAGESC